MVHKTQELSQVFWSNSFVWGRDQNWSHLLTNVFPDEHWTFLRPPYSGFGCSLISQIKLSLQQSIQILLRVLSLFLSLGLKGSLQRLQLEYVDVVFANRPDSNSPMEGKWGFGLQLTTQMLLVLLAIIAFWNMLEAIQKTMYLSLSLEQL